MEFLITVTAIIFLFVTLVQYGIRLHANRVAEAAAREGAVAAARFDGTTESGRTTADKYVTTAGAVAVRGSTVSASRSQTEARVTVTVEIVALMPWLDEPVTSTATAPVERFVQPSREFTNSEGSSGGN